mgnify:CR=1 FL=1
MAFSYKITHNGNTWNSSSDVSSLSISNGSTTASMGANSTKTLNCSGKIPSNNIVIGAKTLNCKGKVMAGNVVITTLTYLRVGGRIFYDNGSNGATYTFYDSNIISTQTIAGLANAYYYTISGTPTKDRWYVYDSSTMSGLWGYSAWGPMTSNSIGSGKTNTATVLSKGTPANNYAWKLIYDSRNNSLNGCNDWFCASMAEQDKLRASGLVDWYTKSRIWSSVDNAQATAMMWDYAYSYWGNGMDKIRTNALMFPARSF